MVKNIQKLRTYQYSMYPSQSNFYLESPQQHSQITHTMLQYFNSNLPIPTPNLMSQFQTLPPVLQTEQNYRQLRKQNERILQQKFNKIINVCMGSLPQNSLKLTQNQIVQRMAQTMRKEALNDYSYNDYASTVESYGYKAAGTAQTSHNGTKGNREFTNDVLTHLLKKYTQHYSVSPVPDAYSQTIDTQLSKKLGAKLPSFINNQNFALSESQEVKKAVQVDKNAQMLKKILQQSKQAKNSPNKQQNLQAQSNTNPMQALTYMMSANLHNESQRINNRLNIIHAEVNPNAPPTINPQGKRISQTFNEDSFKNLTFYEFHMLNHLSTTITLNHCRMIKRQPFIQVAYNALMYAVDTNKESRNENFRNQLQEKVNAELNFGLSLFNESNIGTQQKCYYQIQSWMIVMITIYKCMADQYDPYRRRILKNVFQYCSNPTFINVIECLRWLENNRLEILALEDVKALLSRASAVIFDVYKERRTFITDGSMEELPDFRLINLSPEKLPRRKVVNIWVSGFLSENMDKKSHWKALTKFMPDSEIYAVQWKSDKISRLVKFIGKACIDLITADKMRDELKKKYSDNPFIPAIKISINLGKYLAEMLVRLFPSQFINITGYSLGSQMIKSFMERLIQIKQEHILNNVYMLGGVSDCKQLQAIIGKSKYPWCVYNLHTANDMVLKHILSLCTPDVSPLGINQLGNVKGHQIINVDCSDFISGHLAYMSEFDVVGQVLSMNKE